MEDKIGYPMVRVIVHMFDLTLNLHACSTSPDQTSMWCMCSFCDWLIRWWRENEQLVCLRANEAFETAARVKNCFEYVHRPCCAARLAERTLLSVCSDRQMMQDEH